MTDRFENPVESWTDLAAQFRNQGFKDIELAGVLIAHAVERNTDAIRDLVKYDYTDQVASAVDQVASAVDGVARAIEGLDLDMVARAIDEVDVTIANK